MVMDNEELRLRCIEAAGKQTVNFQDTMVRAERFFGYVKGIKDPVAMKTPEKVDKVAAITEDELPAAARPKKGPVNLAENIKSLT